MTSPNVDDRPFRERFHEYARTLDCVHCGLCIPHCPTHGVTGREADSPRGRIHLMRGWAEGRFELTDSAWGHLESCLVCRACESVCPSGIRMGEMAEGFRAEMAERGRPSAALTSRPVRALLDLLPHRGRIAALSDAIAAYRALGLQRLGDAALAAVAPGLRPLHARLPAIPPRHTRRVETERARPGGWTARGERRARVALFLGCIAAEWFAPVHRATIRVLTANGCDVVVPHDQTCCGALDRHSGRLDRARDLLERNRRAFAAAGVDCVVTNAAGCGASLREPLETAAPPEGAMGAGARGASPDGAPGPPVLDVCAFLADLGLRDPSHAVRRRVVHDRPCHLVHAQRVPGTVVEGLLERVPGLELLPLPGADRCCGAAGVYNLLHAAMADPILDEKIQAIRATGADTVATGNPGCAMQIAHGLARARLDIAVVHPVELLDLGYGGEAAGDRR